MDCSPLTHFSRAGVLLQHVLLVLSVTIQTLIKWNELSADETKISQRRFVALQMDCFSKLSQRAYGNILTESVQ